MFLRIHRGAALFPRRGAAFDLDLPDCRQRVAQPPAAVAVSLDHDGSAERVTATLDRRFGDLELRDRLEKVIARLLLHDRRPIAAHYLDGGGMKISRRP